MLNREFPRVINADRPVGLYIEVKDWQWGIDYAGIDQAVLLMDELEKNGLATVEDSQDDIPIVI